MKTIFALVENEFRASRSIPCSHRSTSSTGFISFVTGFLIILSSLQSFAQGVGINEYATITPDPTSLLELRSTERGFLPPRMTTVERDNITTPANGLMIFNTTTGEYNIYDNGWVPLSIKREFDQLTADFSTTGTAWTNVTGLNNFLLEANASYYFKFKCLATTSAATVGINLCINSTQAISSINYIHMYPISATAITYEQVTALQGGTLSTAGPGTTRREYCLEGTITTSATAPTITLQVRAETAAGTAQVRAGSFGWFKKI
jgi:hypothetical protein